MQWGSPLLVLVRQRRGAAMGVNYPGPQVLMLQAFPHNLFAQVPYGHGEWRGKAEMYGESNMETYMTICKIDSQRRFAV